MARYRKITKKELKHDRFLDTGVKLTRYAKQHKNLATVMMIGLIVVIAGVLLFRDHRRDISERADSELMRAELAYLRGDFQGAFMEFEIIQRRYRRTSAGRRALYFMGHLMQLQGRPSDAINHFEEFLSVSRNESILIPGALLGIAVSRVQLGDMDGAIASYEETVKRFPGSYFARKAYLSLAELKEMMGDIDGSIEIYKKIRDIYLQTELADKAEERIKFLQGMNAVTRLQLPPDIGDM